MCRIYRKEVKIDDPVNIVRYKDGKYYLYHNNHYIGRLSGGSRIAKMASEIILNALMVFLSAT